VLCVVLEEAVCEAAGGAAEVSASEGGGAEFEGGEGVLELDAAAGDEAVVLLGHEVKVGGGGSGGRGAVADRVASNRLGVANVVTSGVANVVTSDLTSDVAGDDGELPRMTF